jgi:hypothetical protein
LTSSRPRRHAGARILAAAAAAALLDGRPARAFVYSEHRAIAGAAIAGLNHERAETLTRLWAAARQGYEIRLCAQPWTGEKGLEQPCVDLAAWSSLSGDHSCSPSALLAAVLEGGLVLRMNEIAAEQAEALSDAERDDQRRNAVTTGQIQLMRLDPSYASSAGANNAHFLLPRQTEGLDILHYMDSALRTTAEPNSAATYFYFHGAAMVLAASSDPAEAEADKGARARLILALEAFAEHFLEDMFAAGHVAGSWGNVAERKGTHDYYNRAGLEVRSWNGEETVLFGDAFLKPEGLARAAQAVRTSLDQVLEAWTPGTPARIAAQSAHSPEDALSGTFSVCASRAAPDWDISDSLEPWFAAVAMRMPVPFRGAGPGSLPRIHGEIGPYVGLVAGGSLAGSGGSYDDLDTGGQLIDSLTLGLRFGLGLEELITDSGDGMIFLEGDVAMSSAEDTDCPGCEGEGRLLPRVPARSGIGVRFRAPFWLIPGDLIVAAPFLLLTDPHKFEEMAATAATGGLIPWQRRFHTPIGSFQLMVGREVGAIFYGYTGGLDEFVTFDPATGEAEIVGYKSVVVEIPVLEYRAFRSYGSKQALDLRLQFGAGFDKPLSAEILDPPGAPAPDLHTRYFGYMRLVFEGRRYF